MENSENAHAQSTALVRKAKPQKSRKQGKPEERPLTARQNEFVRLYCKYRNVQRAYRESGYRGTSGMQLFESPKVQGKIQAYLARSESRLQVSVDRVTRELARIAFADLRTLYDSSGRPIALHELSDDAAAAVQSLRHRVSSDGNTDTTIKLADKQAALTVLAKSLGMLRDDPAQGVQVNIQITRD